MGYPLRARYGVRDNMHALLEWDTEAGEPPPELLGLTDKPPGSYSPGDRWWPSVGCGPVSKWWALWWTRPDQHANRGGMVLSEVALWPLDQVGHIDDLHPILEELSGKVEIGTPSPESLRAVAEYITLEGAPPVFGNLDEWPGVIAVLWKRLWPAARQAFSARIAVSPPQGGESVAPPWIFGIPIERIPQWAAHRIVTPAQYPSRLNRAASWLVGEADPTLHEVLTGSPLLASDLGGLRRSARAADRLDRLREVPDAERALELLRTLAVIAPGAESARALKIEALNALKASVPTALSSSILSLANLKPEPFPPNIFPDQELAQWVDKNAPTLHSEQSLELLLALSEGRAERWWQKAVSTALSNGWNAASASWDTATVRWLGVPSSAEVLAKLLPTTEEFETRLLATSPTIELSESALHNIRSIATARRWSRLHAWSLPKILSPKDAFAAQFEFIGDPRPGLELLVREMPGTVVVEEALQRNDAHFTSLVARRTTKDPALLRDLDASDPHWLSLWDAHVSAGGTPWPIEQRKIELGAKLLDAVLDNKGPNSLVQSLAVDLADIALHYPRRTELWQKLSPPAYDALLPQVAEGLLKLCESEMTVSSPEMPLAAKVVKIANARQLTARALAALLSWDVSINEIDAIRWLSHGNWSEVAADVGHSVCKRGWRDAASEIYRSYIKQGMVLRPAVEACQELLSYWNLFCFTATIFGARSTTTTGGALARRAAELGADLAPDSLDDIWVRAGGERKRLRSWGAPDTRWRDAVSLAQSGALRGGLLSLVQALEDDFPHNKEVRELRELVSSASKERRL